MKQQSMEIQELKILKVLFSDSRVSWLWLLLRVYVGYEWLTAGSEKFTSPLWIGNQAGTAIKGFFAGSLQKMTGAHPDVSSWYGYFISNVAMPNAVFFSYLITFGEIAVGLGLILGALTGLAAFFGAFMNFNFLFAGTVSINPFLLLIEIFLVLAWRNAGWIGLDRWILPRLMARHYDSSPQRDR